MPPAITLTDDAYDDSPWTRDELQAVARGTADRSDWGGETDEPTVTSAGQR